MTVSQNEEAREEWESYQRRQAHKAILVAARRKFALRRKVINSQVQLTETERQGAIEAARKFVATAITQITKASQ